MQQSLSVKCDKCGADMKLREAKKTGKQFWGCPNWKPNNEGCDGIKQYQGSVKAEPSNSAERKDLLISRMSSWKSAVELVASDKEMPYEDKIKEVKKIAEIALNFILTGNWKD